MILCHVADLTTPRDIRESFSPDLSRAPAGVESVWLSTCHRRELYLAGPSDTVVAFARSVVPESGLTTHSELDAVNHLFRVASGLESVAVGEPQVLTQIRSAAADASRTGHFGPTLRSVFDRAVSVGRRARSRTPLGALNLSIGSLAAERVLSSLGELDSRSGLIVGTGEAALDAAVQFAKSGAELTVVGRRVARAIVIAEEVGATYRAFDEIADIDFDFAVVALSSPGTVPCETFSRAQIVVDVSAPSALFGEPNYELVFVDELTLTPDPAVSAAVDEAGRLVERELNEYRVWLDARSAASDIQLVAQHFEELANNSATPDETRRALGPVLHRLISTLKRSNAEERKTILRGLGIQFSKQKL